MVWPGSDKKGKKSQFYSLTSLKGSPIFPFVWLNYNHELTKLCLAFVIVFNTQKRKCMCKGSTNFILKYVMICYMQEKQRNTDILILCAKQKSSLKSFFKIFQKNTYVCADINLFEQVIADSTRSRNTQGNLFTSYGVLKTFL